MAENIIFFLKLILLCVPLEKLLYLIKKKKKIKKVPTTNTLHEKKKTFPHY